MAYRVEIDKRRCLSAGNCIAHAPEAFDWDEDALGDALPAAGELPLQRLVEIAKRCPAFCITIHDEDGNEIDVG